MEELSKTQLVLLALLVSFITSIATGIMTVSLLQEAPANVTQTINRVVERTIERVVTEGGTQTVREVQVVNTDEQVVAAISKNAKTLVRIRQTGVDGRSAMYAIGLVIKNDNTVVAERTPGFTANLAFSAILPDGALVSADFLKEDLANKVVFFKLNDVPKDGTAVASLSKSLPKLGQTVVAIEGEVSGAVSIGRVNHLSGETEGEPPRVIETDIVTDHRTPGAVLVNLSGEVLGIRMSEAVSGSVFFPVRLVESAINSL